MKLSCGLCQNDTEHEDTGRVNPDGNKVFACTRCGSLVLIGTSLPVEDLHERVRRLMGKVMADG